MNLKDTWKDVGKGLGSAFTDLGMAVIKSAKTGIDIVDEWATSDMPKPVKPIEEKEVSNQTADDDADDDDDD